MSGWGLKVFTGYSHWWLIPVLACHLGGVLGAIIYWLLLHNDAEEKEEEEERIIREVTMANINSRSGQAVAQEHGYLHVSFTFKSYVAVIFSLFSAFQSSLQK